MELDASISVVALGKLSDLQRKHRFAPQRVSAEGLFFAPSENVAQLVRSQYRPFLANQLEQLLLGIGEFDNAFAHKSFFQVSKIDF